MKKYRCLRQDVGFTGISDTRPKKVIEELIKVVEEITEGPEYLTKKLESSFVKS